MESPIINIEGDLVALGPLTRELIPLFQRWFNQFEMQRTLGVPAMPMTLESETSWYDAAAMSSSTTTFVIYERTTMRPIGDTSLTDIDYRNGTATFGIAIGEQRARGKGYGTETARLMLDYAFTALGLHNVMLTVYEFNLGARRAYEKAGFKEIGRRRKSRQMGGTYWDDIYMDAVAGEFESTVLAKVFAPDEPR